MSRQATLLSHFHDEVKNPHHVTELVKRIDTYSQKIETLTKEQDELRVTCQNLRAELQRGSF
jgi:chaperonin cofactor prefoldin